MISIGEELKREREFREISLRDIAEATKINVRMLEAIEKDHFEALPGGIFNRNFIRAYAEFIGLDPEVIIRKYLVQTGTDMEAKLPASVIVPVDRSDRTISPKMLVVCIAVLLVLILLYAFWRYPDQFRFKRADASTLKGFLVSL